MWVKGRSLPGSPLIRIADKSKSCQLYAHRLAREALENELLKSDILARQEPILRRGETQKGPAMLYAPGPMCFATSLDPHENVTRIRFFPRSRSITQTVENPSSAMQRTRLS